jgi:hypothetical protein
MDAPPMKDIMNVVLMIAMIVALLVGRVVGNVNGMQVVLPLLIWMVMVIQEMLIAMMMTLAFTQEPLILVETE